ncbi:hypothetical protein M1E11_13880 [Bacillus sp. JZ8]
MEIIHTMPLLLFDTECNFNMMKECFESLGKSSENTVVLYNQGYMENEVLRNKLINYGISPIILGEGQNIGIAQARQLCFSYIWEHYPDVHYISEIHLDMIFPKEWYTPLIEYLNDSDEPIISPGIMTSYGELQPIGRWVSFPLTIPDLLSFLEELPEERIVEGFVHPVIHKAHVLKEIGGYDTRFFKGKQGYEDDSILLGYLYYMGTRTKWRPKCYLKSWVYHATMAQRMMLPDTHIEFVENEKGLFSQYGGYGLKHLAAIHHNPAFIELLEHFLKNE